MATWHKDYFILPLSKLVEFYGTVHASGIDENLIRNNITVSITIGELANRRDEILAELGLRAKQGDNRFTNDRGADSAPLKITTDIAQEMGKSERVLQENKQLARDFIPEAKEAIREMGIQKSVALAISRLEPEEQKEIVKNDKKDITVAIRDKAKQKEVPEQSTPSTGQPDSEHSNPTGQKEEPAPDVSMNLANKVIDPYIEYLKLSKEGQFDGRKLVLHLKTPSSRKTSTTSQAY